MNEFIEQVDKMGYITRIERNHLTKYDELIVRNTQWNFFASIPLSRVNSLVLSDVNNVSDKFFELCVEFARTPIDKRSEVKLYIAKHKWIVGDVGEDKNFLKYDFDWEDWTLGDDHLQDGQYRIYHTGEQLEERGIPLEGDRHWHVDEVKI